MKVTSGRMINYPLYDCWSLFAQHETLYVYKPVWTIEVVAFLPIYARK